MFVSFLLKSDRIRTGHQVSVSFSALADSVIVVTNAGLAQSSMHGVLKFHGVLICSQIVARYWWNTLKTGIRHERTEFSILRGVAECTR